MFLCVVKNQTAGKSYKFTNPPTDLDQSEQTTGVKTPQESNVRPSIWQLKLSPDWVMHEDNDPWHNRNSTTQGLKKKKLCKNECLQIWMNRNNVMKNSGPKFLQNNVRD